MMVLRCQQVHSRDRYGLSSNKSDLVPIDRGVSGRVSSAGENGTLTSLQALVVCLCVSAGFALTYMYLYWCIVKVVLSLDLVGSIRRKKLFLKMSMVECMRDVCVFIRFRRQKRLLL